jgi:hypothetical protein
MIWLFARPLVWSKSRYGYGLGLGYGRYNHN